MKIIIITGSELRHRFFAYKISKSLNLEGIIFEKKSDYQNKLNFEKNKLKIIQDHFNQRNKSESKYFISAKNFKYKKTLNIEHKESNNPEVFNWINQINPNIILLFGSSIIKDKILEKYTVINLHLGLSPYYRGSGTNFWPMVENKIECVGATIHLATSKLDAGKILHQTRPIIKRDDSPHDIGNKVIISAIRDIPKIIKKFNNNDLELFEQDLSKGKLFLRKNLTPESITQLYKNFKNNLILKFLENQEEKLNNYPIVNNLK